MPSGSGTVNVVVWEEKESQIDLIHGVHIAHRRGGDVRRSDHSGRLGELGMDHGRRW